MDRDSRQTGMDRDSRQTGKERGGGMCLYVSEKFCDRANVTVKQRMCTPGRVCTSEAVSLNAFRA